AYAIMWAGRQRKDRRGALRPGTVNQASRMSLEEIQVALAGLPADKAPAKVDRVRLSRAWRPRLDARIKEMEKLRDELTGCIGCGCLSLRTCRLINRDDVAAQDGAGSYLLARRDPAGT
ncbi:MAG TPA: MerR family DNA-binding protein, partial [Candidatus Limnocylindrales bacterium]|nr:MerR family DNA-binding protein [Candidatus Limnocylindrales bacterium]